MNTASAKINMIKQQLRPSGVLDESILSLFEQTPRDRFTPEAYQDVAYSDMMIPLTKDQAMLSPLLEAKILEVLNIQPTDKILEVGTGTGYLTTLLALKGNHVYSVDYHDTYTATVENNLAALNIKNVTLQINNATIGWDKQQPYDVIVITGSLDFLPKAFLAELTIGGRIFVVINDGPAMQAYLITRKSEQSWEHKKLFKTHIPPFAHALKKTAFTF